MSITIAERYRRGARLAQGGSSSIHRAVDLTTGAEVALKSFHVHRAFDAALMPSLEAARRLAERAGPSAFVPILDLGVDEDGAPFVVMPLVPGQTLGELLDAGSVSDERALTLVRRTLCSLDALHACGATHGDLAPDNVLITEDGRALLLDHESLGLIGAAVPTRRTEGFEGAGSVRGLEDDHAALAALAVALSGRERSPKKAVSIQTFVEALRREDWAGARAALDWSAASNSALDATPAFFARPRFVLGALACTALLVISVALVRAC